MKTNNSIFALMVIATVGLLSSCDNEDSAEATFSETEAADEISSAVVTDLVEWNDDMIGISEDIEEAGRTDATCEVKYDSTVTKSYLGTYIDFDSEVSYEYNFTCQTPKSFTFDFTAESSANTPRFSLNAESSGSLVLTGMDQSNTSYVVNGTTERSSELQQLLGAQHSFTSSSELTVTNLSINKTSYTIESGTVAVALLGSSSSGVTKTYMASVTFNGDQTASVNINDKYFYIIDLSTGQITEA